MHKQLPMVSHLCAGHSRYEESDLRSAASGCGPRLSGPSSASVHSWHGSELRRRPTPHGQASATAEQTTDRCRIVSMPAAEQKPHKKPLCFTRGVHQLMLCGRATLSIEHGNLLKSLDGNHNLMMIIRAPFLPPTWFLNQPQSRGVLEPGPLSNQPFSGRSSLLAMMSSAACLSLQVGRSLETIGGIRLKARRCDRSFVLAGVPVADFGG